MINYYLKFNIKSDDCFSVFIKYKLNKNNFIFKLSEIDDEFLFINYINKKINNYGSLKVTDKRLLIISDFIKKYRELIYCNNKVFNNYNAITNSFLTNTSNLNNFVKNNFVNYSIDDCYKNYFYNLFNPNKYNNFNENNLYLYNEFFDYKI